MIRIAALAGLTLLVGACTTTQDPNWRPSALHSDPLVHGPFLIGADRPSVGHDCVRPGAVRSQDAKSHWNPCPTQNLVDPLDDGAVIEPLPPLASTSPQDEELAMEAPRPRGPRPQGRQRSAWEG